ncbi:hypothetical protein CRYUN_Cryun26dG0054400 [Craigia yunnanensis]
MYLNVFEENKEATSFIHPTAVVHPNAVIGQGVAVGPFCTIGSSAKLGNGCRLHPWSHIFGNKEFGNHCILITHHAVVGIKCQDMKYKVIGDKNLIMESCHVAHDCKIGNNNIFANSTLLAGHIIVEVSQDVPKYMMVSGERAELRGLNLEGLCRCGFQVMEDTMKIWAVFLLYVPCSSPFVILLLKIIEEYANSDNGAVLESIAKFAVMYYMPKLPDLCSRVCSFPVAFLSAILNIKKRY